jgi:hypothetical protein
MRGVRIKATGWPWQKTGRHWSNCLDKTDGERWGWNPLKVKGMGRFGGGWAFKLGITVSESLTDWVLDLGIGSIRVVIDRKGGAT